MLKMLKKLIGVKSDKSVKSLREHILEDYCNVEIKEIKKLPLSLYSTSLKNIEPLFSEGVKDYIKIIISRYLQEKISEIKTELKPVPKIINGIITFDTLEYTDVREVLDKYSSNMIPAEIDGFVVTYISIGTNVIYFDLEYKEGH